MLWMKVDDESVIRKTRVETNHCVHAPAAQARQSVPNKLSIHFIDLMLLHGSVSRISTGLHGALFRGHLDTAPYAIDCRKPIDEIVVILTKAPDKNGKPSGQKC